MELPLYILKFGETGVTWIDLLLVTLCPLAGWIGTKVNSVMQRKKNRNSKSLDAFIESNPNLVTSESDSPEEIIKNKYKLREAYFRYINEVSDQLTGGDMIAGMALGLVVSLYFFGAITQDVTSLARVVGLCILLGYQAPNIWKAQEKVISDIVDKKLVQAIKNATKNK